MDIKGFFDNIDWALLLKAVRKHSRWSWVTLYIQRWLSAAVVMPDGTVQARDRGTPQGGVISPLLVNLFLHHAFDGWMQRHHPSVPFERYADDIICHCDSQAQAQALKAELERRLAECGLQLHPEKTKADYYAAFRSSTLYRLLRPIDEHLVLWSRRKYKRLDKHRHGAWEWLKELQSREPRLFPHWWAAVMSTGR